MGRPMSFRDQVYAATTAAEVHGVLGAFDHAVAKPHSKGASDDTRRKLAKAAARKVASMVAA